jgi:hypothetical protein
MTMKFDNPTIRDLPSAKLLRGGTDRICNEPDPKYADVTVEHREALTARQAVPESNGRTPREIREEPASSRLLTAVNARNLTSSDPVQRQGRRNG